MSATNGKSTKSSAKSSAKDANVIVLEDDDHHEDLMKDGLHNEIVVYIFSASWCGPCKSFKPQWEKIAKKYPSIKFLYTDIDECPDLTTKHGVMSIPAVQIYKPGKGINLYTAKANETDLSAKLKAIAGF